MSIGKRIQAARKRLPGMTQIKLGQVLGISDKAISSWERDETKPEGDRYPDLVKALKITYRYLCEGGNQKPPDPSDLEVLLDTLPATQQGRAKRVLRALWDDDVA